MRRKYEITITTRWLRLEGRGGTGGGKEMGRKECSAAGKDGKERNQDVKIMKDKREKKEKTGCK